MWKGHIEKDSTIEVPHFGPLGWGQKGNWDQQFNKKSREFTKKLLNIANVSDFLQWKKKSKADKDKDIANMKLEIRRCFLKGEKEKDTEIDRTKSDLKEIIKKEFGSSDETVSDLFIKLDQEKWNNVENDVVKLMIKA